MRPLIFASLQPELAEAKGVPLRFVSTAFLAIVALAVSECAQIVGVLLVFTLMVGPPAAAQRVTTGLWSGLLLSAALALAEAWLGITHRLSHRLAGELLHRRAQRARLFRLPRRCRRAQPCARARTLKANGPAEAGPLRRRISASAHIFTPFSVKYFTAPGCHGIGE